MNLDIITLPLEVHIYGFSGIAINEDYAGIAFKLSGQIWQEIKTRGLKNKGKNIWVYEDQDRVFAGVELEEKPPADSGLEHKAIELTQYAYHKHIGSYKLIGAAGKAMQKEIQASGFETRLPYIEIYGHWNVDESKLETELLMSLK